MSGKGRRATSARAAPTFRTVGATTAWSTAEAEQMLHFLDALREDIWTRYGEDIAAAHHIDACADAQHTLPLEDPPF